MQRLPVIDVESVERATLAAVPPQAQEELPGWLLGLDRGTVGRAHSAVPLQHVAPQADVLATIEARYAAHGLAPVLRLPRLACFDAMRTVSDARGYASAKPVLVQVGTVRAMAAIGAGAGIALAPTPDEGWAAVLLGEGFDPVDGASRLAILRRAIQSVFAGVQVQGQVVAVGSACFSHGWCGIHGMRTAPAFRGRGLASRILAALAAEAQRRGIERAFLQVEEGNPAQALYRRAGFATAWVYEYWQRRAAAQVPPAGDASCGSADLTPCR